MKLSLADLTCNVLDLSTDGARPIEISLRELQDGRGELEIQSGLTLLERISLRALYATLRVPIGDGHIRTALPALITNLTCHGRLRSGFAGDFQGSLVETESVELSIGSVEGRGRLRAEDITLRIDGRGGRVGIGSIGLQEAQFALPGWTIRAESISLTGLKVAWERGRRVQIAALKGYARNLSLLHDRTRIEMEAIDIPEGFTSAERIQMPSLLVGSARVSLEELSGKEPGTDEQGEGDAGLSEPPEAEPAAEAESVEKAESVGELASAAEEALGISLDYGVFDTLNGNLDVDLTMSATVPVLGKRTATHHFRIPIEGGIINYRELERDLSDLEDAFIDITLRGDYLVLERDIPLIPGLQKPILKWRLGEGDRELAQQYLVRLRTLPNLEFPRGEPRDKDRKSRFALHRLDFDNLIVALSLDETAVLKSGEGGLRAHCDELELRGNMHYEPKVALEPTEVRASAKGLGTVLDRLPVRGLETSAEFQVGAVESLVLTLDKMRPRRIEGILKNVWLSNLDVQLTG